MQKRGKYIIFEGGEGCGKSTQIKLLEKYLTDKNILVKSFREPGGTHEAEAIRALFKDVALEFSPLAQLYLMQTARTELFQKEIIPNIEKGVHCLVDRSFYSSLTYQGYGDGIELELIEKLNKESTFGLIPDLAIFIDIYASRGLKKEIEKDNAFSEKDLGYHLRVNEGYRKIAKQCPEGIIMIKYQENQIQAMQDEIRRIVQERLNLEGIVDKDF